MSGPVVDLKLVAASEACDHVLDRVDRRIHPCITPIPDGRPGARWSCPDLVDG